MKIKEFEELKDSSLGHALIKAGRIYNNFAFEALKKSIGDEELRPSHVALFAHIPFEGITIVDLAKRAQITKQAVSVLVNFLLERDVLIKMDNPNDKRSILVSFNQSKGAAVMKGMKLIKKHDKELIELLGIKNSKTTLASLLKVIEVYGEGSQT
ncbi:hypothetical protein A9Q84_15285 [Halobacteriovorax marinus]|uniref:HTH marR-type domain-containing protein n=1 Tax=Halobacteriovorax marinus TaxID=97084 RepID=A0A1Y5F5B8_9BACT|nr:hypothetical protein A9Q84_15285 [Halobacteriovorax marinus]